MKPVRSISWIVWGFLCLLILSFVLVSSLVTLANSSGLIYLTIAKVEKENNRVVARLALSVLTKRKLVTVDGPLGKTTIEIEGARARVIDSPCRDKVCIHFGWLSKKGDFSACLPNRVLVTAEAAPGQ